MPIMSIFYAPLQQNRFHLQVSCTLFIDFADYFFPFPKPITRKVQVSGESGICTIIYNYNLFYMNTLLREVTINF